MTTFSEALRGSSLSRFSRIKEREARLSGRPLTLSEAAAPYEALAETAASRLAAGKGLELQEQEISNQASQFGQTLAQRQSEEARRSKEFDLQQILERERLAELKRSEEARIGEWEATREAQMAAAESAGTRESWSTAITGARAVYDIGASLGWWPGVTDVVKDVVTPTVAGTTGTTGAAVGGAAAAGGAAGAGMAAGGAYGSGSLGYGGVALGSSGAGAGGAGAAGAAAGMPIAAVAGPLAGAAMLSQTHKPFESALNFLTGG